VCIRRGHSSSVMPLDLVSAVSSRTAAPRIDKRRRVFSTGWQHLVENPGPERTWSPRPPAGEALVSRHPVTGGVSGSSVKGTSGSEPLPSSRKGGPSSPRPRPCQRELQASSAQATRCPRPALLRAVRVVGSRSCWSLQPARRRSHDERCRHASGDRQCVLAGRVGCRSRRAALGPGPKGHGPSSPVFPRKR